MIIYFQMKKTIFIIIISAILLSGCKKEKAQVVEENSIQLNIQPVKNEEVLDSQNQAWHVTNKRVCVIFGYGLIHRNL